MKKKKKRNRGKGLIRFGSILILVAIMITGYNLYDASRAERASKETLEMLIKELFPADETKSDHVPNGDVSFLIPPNATQSEAEAEIEIKKATEEESRESTPDADPLIENTMPGDNLDDDRINIDSKKDEAAEEGQNVPKTEQEIPDYVLNPNMKMPTKRQNGQDYIGILEIPAIKIKLPVISEWSYSRLKKAPCRYVGSVYAKNMVIAAHNYPAHFGNLNKLYEGAAVIFTDMDGNVFNYRVDYIETLNPHDIEYMKEGGWDLSLFTCTPGGSYRVTIRCNEVFDGNR